MKIFMKIISLVLIISILVSFASYATQANGTVFFEENKIYEEHFDEEKINQKFIEQHLIKEDNVYECKISEDIIVNVNVIELTVNENTIEELKAQLPDNFSEDKINWKKVITQFTVGTSIIVAVGVINCVTKGASTYFLFASPAKVAKDAIVGGAIGATLNTTIKSIQKGKIEPKSCKKYAIEGFAEGYMWGAIYSVIGTSVENLKRLKTFKFSMGGEATIKVDGSVFNKAGKKIGQAFYNEKEKIWLLYDKKSRIIKNVFDSKGKEIANGIKLAKNARIDLSSDIAKLAAYTDDAAKVYRTANNLISNHKYQLNGYEYYTDKFGRIKKVVFKKLKLKPNRPRLDIVDKMDDIGKGFQKVGDDRGHLIADLFDGDPSMANIVPMDKKINQNTIKSIENIWSEALKDGKKVSGSINISYSGKSFRPNNFEYSYCLDGAKSIIQKIIN